MALLTVPVAAGFSASAVVNIAEIRFTGAAATTATFASTQFDKWRSADASGWTFQN